MSIDDVGIRHSAPEAESKGNGAGPGLVIQVNQFGSQLTDRLTEQARSRIRGTGNSPARKSRLPACLPACNSTMCALEDTVCLHAFVRSEFRASNIDSCQRNSISVHSISISPYSYSCSMEISVWSVT